MTPLPWESEPNSTIDWMVRHPTNNKEPIPHRHSLEKSGLNVWTGDLACQMRTWFLNVAGSLGGGRWHAGDEVTFILRGWSQQPPLLGRQRSVGKRLTTRRICLANSPNVAIVWRQGKASMFLSTEVVTDKPCHWVAQCHQSRE